MAKTSDRAIDQVGVPVMHGVLAIAERSHGAGAIVFLHHVRTLQKPVTIARPSSDLRSSAKLYVPW